MSKMSVHKYRQNTQKAINATIKISGIMETWHLVCVQPFS